MLIRCAILGAWSSLLSARLWLLIVNPADQEEGQVRMFALEQIVAIGCPLGKRDRFIELPYFAYCSTYLSRII